ncbi:hypothetical protein DFR57_11511 [Saliterribacillus persicus]|uniref:Uncharacterized protein n=1 Tax=Saliterribacillus persicus TaxID=930114 RepID=A0A368X9H3_9BACI|nr:hypothetical protein DFR57_11511 [Saliterribacillus persicus]
MKWLLLQILTLGAIGILMGVLEWNEGKRVVSSSANWTPANNVYITFIIVTVVLSCFYLIFLFEAKKSNNILERSFWNLMPKISISVGVLSIILFLVGGTVGPIMAWVEQWRSLLYVFLIYFLFLIFLFIFSIEHKKQRNNNRINKTIFTSYIWTIVLFFVIFFVF